MKFWWSRKRQEPAPVSGHGTNSNYVGNHCRCGECRDAHRTYQREWTARVQAEFKRTGQLPVYVSHGSLNAYTKYGCRCDSCRQARRNYKRRYYQAKKAMAK